MQLKPVLAAAVGAVLCCLASAPAHAGACVLAILGGGTLAMSTDGTRLGSQESGGASATLTVISVGSSTVQVAAPILTQSGSGYSTATQTLEISYGGTGLLAAVSQGYTSGPTSFPVPNLVSAVGVTFQNRITNSHGFPAGTYSTKTVVTCS